MNIMDARGFSKVRLLIGILGIAILLAGGFIGFFFFMQTSHINSASAFIGTFASDLEQGNTDATFESLDDSLKSDEGVAYYSWLYWSSAFAQNDISIESTPDASTLTDRSIGAVLGGTSDVLFTLNTSIGTKINLTVTKKGSTWTVVDYEVAN